jgi:hypothetical protein
MSNSAFALADELGDGETSFSDSADARRGAPAPVQAGRPPRLNALSRSYVTLNETRQSDPVRPIVFRRADLPHVALQTAAASC